MGFFKKLATVLAILVAALAALSYSPLPDNVEEPNKVRVLATVFRVIYVVGKVKEFFGFDSVYADLTYFQLQSLQGEPMSSNAKVKVTRERIADVPVLVYRPHTAPDSNVPGVVYFHGGGWVLMNADIFDQNVHELALETNTIIFNVDYRLAPQHPYPQPFLDCLKVTKHILQHGAQYGVDVTRVAVMGDSAGGNLAFAVAQNLTREKSDLPALKLQVGLVPVLQAFDNQLPSYVEYNNSLSILTNLNMCGYTVHYLGFEPEIRSRALKAICENRHIPPALRKSRYAEYVDVKLLPPEFQSITSPAPEVATSYDEEVYAKIKDIITDPMFSPLMADDLSGLPVTFIHVSECDILRDEGLMYARRLKDAGVQVELHVQRNGTHIGHFRISPTFLRTSSGVKAIEAAHEFIRRNI